MKLLFTVQRADRSDLEAQGIGLKAWGIGFEVENSLASEEPDMVEKMIRRACRSLEHAARELLKK